MQRRRHDVTALLGKQRARPLKERLLAGAGLGSRLILEEAADQETLKGEVCVSSSDVMTMFTLHL